MSRKRKSILEKWLAEERKKRLKNKSAKNRHKNKKQKENTVNDRPSYRKQLRDERWLECRKKVFDKYGEVCAMCGATSMLQVHHMNYIKDRLAWEYPLEDFMVLCEKCHKKVHFEESIDTQKHKAQVQLIKKLGLEVVEANSTFVDFLYQYHPVRYYFLSRIADGESIVPCVGFGALKRQIK